MTLLSICQNASDELGFDRPTAVIGSAVDEVIKLRRYANKVGLALMKAFPWQVLRTEKTFTSVATQEQTSILPTDFDRFVSETFWDRSDIVLISGPVTAVEWQGMIAQSYSDTSHPRFIYRGSSIYVYPVLTAGHTLAFEYVSKNWCQSSGGTGQTAWAADTDTGVLDEEMLTRGVVAMYMASEGSPLTGIHLNDFLDFVNTLRENDQPDSGILTAGDIFGAGRHFMGAPAVSGSASVID